MRKHYDVLLVGAGLFNAVLAYRFRTLGKHVLVIDRRSHIGGNCHTEMTDGILVHRYGAHIFHTDDRRVWNFANSFNGVAMSPSMYGFVNSPIAVDGEGKVYNLPFNMNTFARLFGVRTPAEAKKAISGEIRAARKAGLKPPYSNLEDAAISMAGTTIYEHLIKGYTEKQWGRPCAELDPSIIKRVPVRFTYDNNYFSDPYQGIPTGGYTAWMEQMFGDVDIMLGVDYNAGRDRWNSLADVVYYSGCVDEYFDYSLGELEYRSLEFRDRVFHTDNWQGNAVVNYTSHAQKYTRSIEHRHFMKDCSADSMTVVSFEYPKKWKRGMEPYYPVNSERNANLYMQYRGMFPEKVIPVGRLGMYRYNDMDDTIRLALDMKI